MVVIDLYQAETDPEQSQVYLLIRHDVWELHVTIALCRMFKL